MLYQTKKSSQLLVNYVLLFLFVRKTTHKCRRPIQIKEICMLCTLTRHMHTTSYHPQSDGLVERANHTIQTMLATAIDEKDEWEECLPKVCLAYNTSEHSATGFTPFYMMFGRQANMPLDILYSG